MSNDFETTFVVELAPAEVWEALTERTVKGEDGASHYVLAGFPSFPPLEVPGASVTTLDEKPNSLLRARKDHHPCQGTEIAIQLEKADTGTKVTIVQSGFAKEFIDFSGKDTVFGHGYQIARDLQLYIERRLTVPGTVWGVQLGARPVQTDTGLVVDRVDAGSFAEKAGLQPGDHLIALRGIRLHDIQQLSTVLALTEAGQPVEITWARGHEEMSAKASF